MILNFKTQINGVSTNFKEKILIGQKIHTIRKKDRWKAGDTIHFSTGARSKNYECFKMGIVVSVQKIQITINNDVVNILVDNRVLFFSEKCDVILNDGFFSFGDFKRWFKNGGEFDLIHWTDKRY
jgi:hypothetical protein